MMQHRVKPPFLTPVLRLRSSRHALRAGHGLLGLGLTAMLACTAAHAATEPESCHTVQLSDVGWTDNAAANGIAVTLLTALGYKVNTPFLALTMNYVSMRNHNVDAFLSNWEPSGAAAIAPFLKDGSVRQISTNLSGAHYTLAVPDYVWNAGLRDFKDIAAWGSKLGYMLFGLEAGNDGNMIVLQMIHDHAFNLGRFRLVESSEQGMLSQVDRMIQSHRPIVFLAWEPHPMNMRFHLRYLTGGDAQFGPDAGATVHTVIRTGYDAQCPNVVRLLSQLRFSIPAENLMMKAIQQDHVPARQAATDWIRAHPEALASWLDGVTTVDGHPGLDAVRRTVLN